MCLVGPFLLETSPGLLFLPELNARQWAKYTFLGVFGSFQGEHESMKQRVQVLHGSVSYRKVALETSKSFRNFRQILQHLAL